MNELRWYDLRAKGWGSIMIKARSQAEAIEKASERWGCDTELICCTGHTPYNSRQVPTPLKLADW